MIPAITGKVELVYEGEQEGPGIVANNLIGKAIRTLFVDYFPNPDEIRKQKDKPNPYKKIVDWFGDGNMVDILNDSSDSDHYKSLKEIPGLEELLDKYQKGVNSDTRKFLMEFALHGLAEFSMLSKHQLSRGLQFKDLLSSMFSMDKMQGEEGEDFDLD